IETELSLAEAARESARVKGLDQSGIVGPLRHFRNEQVLGIVSPPPQGRSLADLYGPGPVQTTDGLASLCEALARLCEAVARAHQQGVVHGFLSPPLIYCQGDAPPEAHGFGAAPIFRLRAPGAAGAAPFLAAFRESLPYMSPQILQGGSEAAPKDDVFSVGAILYALLTGRPHLDEQTLERMAEGEAVEQGTLNPREHNPLVTRRLAATVVRALDWGPEDRPQGLGEVAAELRECRWPEDVVETLIEDAMEKYGEGDVLGAYELLNRGLAADPGNPRVHYAKGDIHSREGEYGWAAKELEGAASIEPGCEVLALLGRCFAEMEGEDEKAIEMFQQALQYDDGAQLREWLAGSLKSVGRWDDALEQMGRAVALEQDQPVKKRRECLLNEWNERVEEMAARRRAAAAAGDTRPPARDQGHRAQGGEGQSDEP
ncbi:MAG: protein kinase domain-containing protein, partial [Planctomycetota bacterium]